MFKPKKEGRLSRSFARLLLLLLVVTLLILVFAIFKNALYGLLAIPFFVLFLVLAIADHRCPHCSEMLLGGWWFLIPLAGIHSLHWLEEVESGLEVHLRWKKANAGYCPHCGYYLLYDDQP